MSKVSNAAGVVMVGGLFSFVIGAGLLVCAGLSDRVNVSMPMDGCYQRIEGSKHHVYQANICRFTDERVNEKVEVNYHPLAYKEMEKQPIGKRFMVETDSLMQKSLSKKGAVSMVGGIALAIIGLIGIIISDSVKRNQRW